MILTHLTRKKCKVFFSADGCDELFGGQQIYYNIFKNEYPNVIIYDGNNVSELLKGAHIVIQTESTTAIEAYLAGKIVISYCPLSDDEKNISVELPRSPPL